MESTAPASSEQEKFSPREFLRGRRPESFSDTTVEESSTIDRSVLDYHLESLTSRGQEGDFEVFCRRLAEREICPNLLPHTGPSGGGDSKVDSETFPVSDALSFAWYIGAGREAATERWAFAFSAKEDWRSKVRADIAKAAGTKRNYNKAFFITSRYVPDRVRAQIEDELRTEYKIDVRILDRSWILDRVFGGRHFDLAVEHLRIPTVTRQNEAKGPHDVERESELEEIEGRIRAASQQGQFGFQFVTDCIDSAILSRGLERPRTDISGRFQRARQAAERLGHLHLSLFAAYQEAWTAYWWYEDFRLFTQLYGEVEKFANGSQNVHDFELLFNLWITLYSMVIHGSLTEDETQIRERTTNIVAELKRLSDDQDRPNSSLQARTLLLQCRLYEHVIAREYDQVDKALCELKEVVQQSEGILGFQFEPLVQLLTESGQVIGDRASYNDLFEAIVVVAAKRNGDVSAARLLIKHGTTQLESERPYDAIKTLGRALSCLYKHESRSDLIHALALCAGAYERVGLLWAARGTMLTAASIATNDFWARAEVTSLQAATFRRMKWLELQLGRLPHTLEWVDLNSTIDGILAQKGYDAGRLAEGKVEFDIILGIYFLKAELWDLKRLCRLPEILDQLGLVSSACALLYALGHDTELPKDLLAEKPAKEDLSKFFTKWISQPAAEDLSEKLALYDGSKVTLASRILGCRVTIECPNSSPCIELSESILAALESLLATGLHDRMASREPTLTINVRKSDFADAPFTFNLIDQDGKPHVDIVCGEFSPHRLTLEKRTKIDEQLLQLLASVLARVFLIRDSVDVVTKLFRDELALERAVHFTSSFATLGNVLGHRPRISLDAWATGDLHEYTLNRKEEWDRQARMERAKGLEQSSANRPQFGEGAPPPELQSRQIKQTEMETFSNIRETLWDQAKWMGAAYLWFEKSPPILALLFRKKDAAAKIFSNWRMEIGREDRLEQIRITTVLRINKRNPHSYRIVIGSNPDLMSRKDVKQAIMISRMQMMEPNSDENLARFLRQYEKYGAYLLAYGIMHDDISEPQLDFENAILKREFIRREAWEISMHDPACVGIQPEDDPIIPPGKKDAPVLEVLRFLRSCDPHRS